MSHKVINKEQVVIFEPESCVLGYCLGFNNQENLKKIILKNVENKNGLEIINQLEINGHMNVDDLYKNLLNKYSNISFATIYKNINIMLEKKYLYEVKIPNKKDVYELVKQKHSHVVCTSCDKIEDITIDTKDLFNKATAVSSYNLNDSMIVFNGLCATCK